MSTKIPAPEDLIAQGYEPLRQQHEKDRKRKEEQERRRAEARAKRFPLVRFDDIQPSYERDYTIKGLLPRTGLAIVWGPPKCGKSFWVTDATLHVALGWPYGGRRVLPGPVVYGAFEGATGFQKRIGAFRQEWLTAEDSDSSTPFFLTSDICDLLNEHALLIERIKEQTDEVPRIVVLDTLNRSMTGSESSDEDMSKYVRAADAIRDAFNCLVIVVHHCGHEGTRPRGHTALMGAADAQIAVRKPRDDDVRRAVVEFSKDGEHGDEVYFQLRQVKLDRVDEDGDPIATCVVELTDPPALPPADAKLTPNQEVYLILLEEAGEEGLTVEEWNTLAYEHINVGARSNLTKWRKRLKELCRVRERDGRWFAEEPM